MGERKTIDTETIRQNVSTILRNNLNLKLISNLRFESRKVLKNQNNGRMKIYPFGKSSGFGTLEDKTTKLKFEKQLRKII